MFQCRWEQERSCYAADTVEQREARLRSWRVTDRARHADQTAEQRALDLRMDRLPSLLRRGRPDYNCGVSNSTHSMPSSQLRSSETWSVMKETSSSPEW